MATLKQTQPVTPSPLQKNVAHNHMTKEHIKSLEILSNDDKSFAPTEYPELKKKEVVTLPISAKGNVTCVDNDRTQADKKQKSFKESFFEFLDETIDETDDEEVPIKKPTWQAIKTEKDADTGATGTNQKQQEETYLHVVESKVIRNGYCYLIFAINSPSLHELKPSFVAWRQEHAIQCSESTYAKQGGINLNYKTAFMPQIAMEKISSK